MLFAFAVSNHVDINIKGNMSEPLKRLLEVCIRALHNLEMAKVPCPVLRWVMNQVADPDPKHHREGFRRLADEVEQTFKADEKVIKNQVQLDDSNIVVVPSMYNSDVRQTFQKSGVDWTRLSQSKSFCDAGVHLRSALRQQTSTSSSDSEPPVSPSKWLQMAHTIFQTISRYPDLTYFADIKQVQHDRHLRKWINEHTSESFPLQEEGTRHQEELECACKLPFYEDAADHARKYFEEVADPLREKFRLEAEKLKCSLALQKRLEGVLEDSLQNTRFQWVQRVNTVSQEKDVRRACRDGHEELTQKIRELARRMPQEPRYTRDLLNAEFDKIWPNIIQKMKQGFKYKDFSHSFLQSCYNLYPTGESQLRNFGIVCQEAHSGDPPQPRIDWLQLRSGPVLPWGQCDPTRVQIVLRSESIQDLDEQVKKCSSLLKYVGAQVVAALLPQSRSEWERQPKQSTRPIVHSEQTGIERSQRRHVASHGQRDAESAVRAWLVDPTTAAKPRPEQVKSFSLGAVDWTKVFHRLADGLDKFLDECRRPDLNLMNKVARQVTQVVEEVNKSLKLLGCTLSREGQGELHSQALIHAWQRLIDSAWQQFQMPIAEFEKSHDKQREYFVGMLLQDDHADRNMAEILADGFELTLLQHLSREIPLEVKTLVSKKTAGLTREKFQERLDSSLGTDDLKMQEAWIGDPVRELQKVVRTEFEAIRVEHVLPAIDQRRELTYFKAMRDLLHRVERLHGDPRIERDTAHSNSLFEIQCEIDGPMQSQQLKQRAAFQYVSDSLLNQCTGSQWCLTNPDDQNVEQEFIVTLKKNSLPDRHDPIPDHLRDGIRNAVHTELAKISNIHEFLEALMGILQSKMADARENLPGDLELQQQVSNMCGQLEDKIIPCSATCPCCGKLCDNSDTGKHHVHCCAHGHLPRGFRGIHLEDRNSSQTCMFVFIPNLL